MGRLLAQHHLVNLHHEVVCSHVGRHPGLLLLLRLSSSNLRRVHCCYGCPGGQADRRDISWRADLRHGGHHLPQAENPGDCITRLTAAWLEIAGLISPRYLDGNAVCGALGSCALREWTCEECTNGLVQIATIFVQQEYIDDIISFLQGEAYSGVHADHPTCLEDIAVLMPAALPVLASVLTVQAPRSAEIMLGSAEKQAKLRFSRS